MMEEEIEDVTDFENVMEENPDYLLDLLKDEESRQKIRLWLMNLLNNFNSLLMNEKLTNRFFDCVIEEFEQIDEGEEIQEVLNRAMNKVYGQTDIEDILGEKRIIGFNTKVSKDGRISIPKYERESSEIEQGDQISVLVEKRT